MPLMTYGPDQPGAGLVGYLLNQEGRAYNPPPQYGGMFDYILGADGLYLHAKREEMDVCFQIAPAEVRGLAECFQTFSFELPKVPEDLISKLCYRAEEWGRESLETLFHLVHSPVYPWDDGWELIEPEQTRAHTRCRPVQPCPSADRAVIEIHSHHAMPPVFSGTDDADETGFRLYGVIGDLRRSPSIRMRVGVYGVGFWQIPAPWALELPVGLRDCNAEEEES
jgi:hypothetical protein